MKVIFGKWSDASTGLIECEAKMDIMRIPNNIVFLVSECIQKQPVPSIYKATLGCSHTHERESREKKFFIIFVCFSGLRRYN